MRRLKVLISARELAPNRGSECGVGWNIVTRLAKYHDVTVIYGSGSQFNRYAYHEAIDEYFQKNSPISGLTLVNVDIPLITRFLTFLNLPFSKMSSIGLPMIYYIGYKYWQKAAYKKAKELHNKYKFDLAHQLTQISFREPGYLWKLGIPFIWGPTGGMFVIPKSFIRSLSSWHGKIIEGIIRKYSNYFQFMYSSRVKQANKRAAIIYTFDREDRTRFQQRATGKIKLMLDVGTYSLSNSLEDIKEDHSKIQGLWCGQLAEYKLPFVLLKALSKSKITREEMQLTIIGKGPLESSMKAFAKSNNLTNINWISSISHEEVFKKMRSSDFLIHTGIKEASTSVIPESLSVGIPVICHDVSGMGIAVNESCGIKIKLESPERSIIGFNSAMEKLILDKELLGKLKKGAKTRATEISWDCMVDTIAEDYTKISRENNLIYSY